MYFCYFLLHYYITLIDIHKNAFLTHSIYVIAVNIVICFIIICIILLKSILTGVLNVTHCLPIGSFNILVLQQFLQERNLVANRGLPLF
jgi:hypothetical protein